MQSPLLRARSPGEILDAAFQLLRANYLPVVLTSAAFLVPSFLLTSLVPEFGRLTNIVDRLLTVAAGAAVAVVVSNVYMGREADVAGSIRAVGRRFGSVAGSAILQGVLLFVGILLLVVPAFIFFAWSFAMTTVVMLEGTGASAAFERSRALAKGYVRHILMTAGVAWVIFLVGFFGIIMLLTLAVDLLGLPDFAVTPILTLGLCLIYPFVGVVTTLLYYDLRIRQEGFDLELAAERIGEPEFAGPPALA